MPAYSANNAASPDTTLDDFPTVDHEQWPQHQLSAPHNIPTRQCHPLTLFQTFRSNMNVATLDFFREGNHRCAVHEKKMKIIGNSARIYVFETKFRTSEAAAVQWIHADPKTSLASYLRYYLTFLHCFCAVQFGALVK